MTEVSFYRLSYQPLEKALPQLLSTIFGRGLRAHVLGQDQQALDRLDERLWTFDDAAFLPHGRADGSRRDHTQPILLSDQAENRNLADVLLLVLGARFVPDQSQTYDRVCVMFDGNDAEALAAARDDWRTVVACGTRAVFWAQDKGRWVKQAQSAPAS